jgi:hypothetical protein
MKFKVYRVVVWTVLAILQFHQAMFVEVGTWQLVYIGFGALSTYFVLDVFYSRNKDGGSK